LSAEGFILNSVNDKVKNVSVEGVAALKKFNKRSKYQDLIDSRRAFWKKEVDDFANSSKEKAMIEIRIMLLKGEMNNYKQ
tara:strand:- start:54 stop:293 length:240 start_codon:yes stop_codon:yes gene_type:complete